MTKPLKEQKKKLSSNKRNRLSLVVKIIWIIVAIFMILGLLTPIILSLIQFFTL